MTSDIYLFHNLLPYVMLNNFLGFEEITVVTFFFFNSIFVNNLSSSSWQFDCFIENMGLVASQDKAKLN